MSEEGVEPSNQVPAVRFHFVEKGRGERMSCEKIVLIECFEFFSYPTHGLVMQVSGSRPQDQFESTSTFN